MSSKVCLVTMSCRDAFFPLQKKGKAKKGNSADSVDKVVDKLQKLLDQQRRIETKVDSTNVKYQIQRKETVDELWVIRRHCACFVLAHALRIQADVNALWKAEQELIAAQSAWDQELHRKENQSISTKKKYFEK